MRTLGIITLTAAFLLPAVRVQAGELTFEDRIRAQESIERVYYAHQIDAKRPFEQAVTPESIRAKVARYLKESRALEVLWNAPITAGALHEELARVARDTRAPDRLLELYAALGNDPVRIQECLIRPILATRLTRARFAGDPMIQAEARREIEVIRSDLLRGAIEPSADHPRRVVVEILQSEEAGHAQPEPNVSTMDAVGHEVLRTELSPEPFDRRRAIAPGRAGDVGEIKESAEAFSVEVLLDDSARGFRSAVFSVPKASWDAWWAAHEKMLDPSAVRPAAGSLGELPRPASVPRAGGTPPYSAAGLGGEAAETAPCLPDDTWTPYLPGGRTRHSAVWTGSVMLVWGGADDRGVMGSGGRYDPSTNSWTPISMLGAPSARWYHLGIWSGSLMVIWGGHDGTTYLSTGGRYDPAADTWTAISTTAAPVPRLYRGDWSGSELLVWGSFESTENTGGRYDPAADAWTPMSTANAPSPRHGFSAIWAGNKFIVWGGVGSEITNTGGRYDPKTDTWTPTALTNAPTPRYEPSAVWTGQEMIVWGGHDLFDYVQTGGRYDPIHDTWNPVSSSGAPSRRSASAIWTGSKMIVWGGYLSGAGPTETGGMYAPDTDSWTPTMSGYNQFGPGPRANHSMVWTGSQVLVFGGDSYVGKVYLFDPPVNLWVAPASQALLPRPNMTTIWTGTLLIGWGGFGPGVFNTGGRYDPALDTWTPTTTLGAPPPRGYHRAVWTGQEMIVWGGYGGSGPINSGGRYDPVSDSWTPTSTLDAPTERELFSATWTGTEMIIWGGIKSTSPQCCFLATGGRYDPRTDTWRATSMLDAPSGRYSHAAVWTGQTLFVWGGVYYYVDIRNQRQYVYLNNGRRYDPSTDTWTMVATLGAPPPRAGHSAIWTGETILVWGGSGPAVGKIELNGGRYDPVLDQWRPTSATTPLNVSGGYTGIVWTGSIMIVWGQNKGPTDSGTGARYDPVLDTWFATSRISAPPFGGELVWIGDAMLVWQEQMHLYALSPDGDHDGVTACGGDCDDGNPAVLPGQAEVCNGIDDDCDGVVDAAFDEDGDGHTTCGGDCNDADPFVWSAPVEVTGLMVIAAPPTQISWSGQDVQAGPETTYDLVSGTTSPSVISDPSAAVCLSSSGQPAYVDGRADPGTGQSFWYLVRARNACGIGTFGGPALDSGILPCP